MCRDVVLFQALKAKCISSVRIQTLHKLKNRKEKKRKALDAQKMSFIFDLVDHKLSNLPFRKELNYNCSQKSSHWISGMLYLGRRTQIGQMLEGQSKWLIDSEYFSENQAKTMQWLRPRESQAVQNRWCRFRQTGCSKSSNGREKWIISIAGCCV